MDTSHRSSRRLHVRKHVSWTAWVTAGKNRIRCHTVDLSANGARLKPRGPIQPGTPVEVQFQPPDGPLVEVAAVVWRVDGDGMAVMFLRNIAVQVAPGSRVPEIGRRGWR
ncbi:MAG: PilZ domain-containing protein [Candidatus Rokuibacteriota bacterium]